VFFFHTGGKLLLCIKGQRLVSFVTNGLLQGDDSAHLRKGLKGGGGSYLSTDVTSAGVTKSRIYDCPYIQVPRSEEGETSLRGQKRVSTGITVTRIKGRLGRLRQERFRVAFP